MLAHEGFSKNTQTIQYFVKPWIPEDKCQCATVRNALNKLGGEPAKLPTVEGHLFFIGRDYEGPNKEALHVGSNNVPQQTMWDAAKAVESIRGQLPAKIRPTEVQWQRTSKKVLQPRRRDNKFCSTKDVYQLRKATKGLVCGPIDKNQHELWFACPCLYHKAWKATYAEGKGYENFCEKVGLEEKTKYSHGVATYTTKEAGDPG